MGHLDLSWSINTPGESIRFILVKIISSRYVGYNNNSNNLKSIISVYSLFACLYLPPRTYFEYPEIPLSVNKLEGFCSPICSWRTSRNNKRGFFVLFQERKQSIWSLKGVTDSKDWCFIFLQRVWKWYGFIVPWLKSPLLKSENHWVFVTLGLKSHYFLGSKTLTKPHPHECDSFAFVACYQWFSCYQKDLCVDWETQKYHIVSRRKMS